MNPTWRRRIRTGSRDWRVLAKVSAIIIGLGVMVAFGIDRVRKKSVPDFPRDTDTFALGDVDIEDPEALATQLLEYANFLSRNGRDSEPYPIVPESLKGAPVAVYEKGLFADGEIRVAAAEKLLGDFPSEGGVSLRRGMAADLFWRGEDLTRARELLAAVPSDKNACQFTVARALAFAQSTEDSSLAASLLDGENLQFIDPWQRRKLAFLSGRWGTMILSVVHQERALCTPPVVLLVLLTAGIWFWILHHFAENRRPVGLLLFFFAVFLGVLSILPTSLFIIYQTELRGLQRTGELRGDLIYYLFGVGLREELCKLLLFLPLLPWLARRKSHADALIAAAFVGLGFALLENVGYLHSRNSDSLGRFLTANFMHMALTGIVGFSLYRALCVRGGRIENFFIDLVIVIIAHAAYDLFITSPQLSSQLEGAGSFIVLALIAFRFFRLLDTHSPRQFQTFHPLGVFIVGASLIVAITLNFVLWDLPFVLGIGGFGQAVVGLLTVSALFINQFRDTS